jgi:hypothetical protein
MIGPDTDHLRRLVGTTYRKGSQHLRLIELLDDGMTATLVFERLGAPPTIQRDQFGEPSRLVPRLISIPLYDDDGMRTNALLQDFEPPLF